eukprot:Rhum_TRINITY_DN14028_c0_g14::Rhum_TRINITY_DN14028_c0_g14_i1::g.68182::m.68182
MHLLGVAGLVAGLRSLASLGALLALGALLLTLVALRLLSPLSLLLRRRGAELLHLGVLVRRLHPLPPLLQRHEHGRHLGVRQRRVHLELVEGLELVQRVVQRLLVHALVLLLLLLLRLHRHGGQSRLLLRLLLRNLQLHEALTLLLHVGGVAGALLHLLHGLLHLLLRRQLRRLAGGGAGLGARGLLEVADEGVAELALILPRVLRTDLLHLGPLHLLLLLDARLALLALAVVDVGLHAALLLLRPALHLVLLVLLLLLLEAHPVLRAALLRLLVVQPALDALHLAVQLVQLALGLVDLGLVAVLLAADLVLQLPDAVRQLAHLVLDDVAGLGLDVQLLLDSLDLLLLRVRSHVVLAQAAQRRAHVLKLLQLAHEVALSVLREHARRLVLELDLADRLRHVALRVADARLLLLRRHLAEDLLLLVPQLRPLRVQRVHDGVLRRQRVVHARLRRLLLLDLRVQRLGARLLLRRVSVLLHLLQPLQVRLLRVDERRHAVTLLAQLLDGALLLLEVGVLVEAAGPARAVVRPLAALVASLCALLAALLTLAALAAATLAALLAALNGGSRLYLSLSHCDLRGCNEVQIL